MDFQGSEVILTSLLKGGKMSTERVKNAIHQILIECGITESNIKFCINEKRVITDKMYDYIPSAVIILNKEEGKRFIEDIYSHKSISRTGYTDFKNVFKHLRKQKYKIFIYLRESSVINFLEDFNSKIESVFIDNIKIIDYDDLNFNIEVDIDGNRELAKICIDVCFLFPEFEH